MSEINTSTEALKQLLISKGIKPSFQRLSVLRYIMDHLDHPSVDVVYKSLLHQIPTLSKTTVYNTLNHLTKNGIISALTIDDVETKYDYIEQPHAHFLCLNCGTIYDIEVDTTIYQTHFVEGHQVVNTQINFKGICNSCKQ